MSASRRDTPMIDWSDVDAVLFDLDGVLTPTAEIHERAWKAMFDDFLTDRAAAGGSGTSERLSDPFSADDYLRFVDGKPRFDGVRSFVESRGIDLPEGTHDDSPGHDTIGALGNAKNAAFQNVLRTDGIAPYPGSLLLVDELEARGTLMAVVSSSRNAREVLVAAGLAPRFEVVVDGNVLAAEGLTGKPAPDMFLFAAERLGSSVERSVVVEDAISGVAAGRAGAFGIVVGVDRGDTRDALAANGATLVVADLGELVGTAGDHPGGNA